MLLYDTYPFKLPPLKYSYDALEPYIDSETMYYHHDKHFQTYIDNLNNVLKRYPALQRLTLKQLLRGNFSLSYEDRVTLHNNAGGVYNHDLFFNGLSPKGNGLYANSLSSLNSNTHLPQGELLAKINCTFGSFENFKEEFNKEALSVFGSGWTVLAIDNANRLKIVTLKNQDTVVPKNLEPLILIDVWEHAYYLKYKNLRAEYLNAIWNVIDFPIK